MVTKSKKKKKPSTTKEHDAKLLSMHQSFPLSKMTPYKGNPRNHEDTLESLVASMGRFGRITPIILREDGTIVAGHARHKAALQRGDKTHPAIKVWFRNEAAFVAYLLADNQIASRSSFIAELFVPAIELVVDGGFGIHELGFTEQQIAGIAALRPGAKDTGAQVRRIKAATLEELKPTNEEHHVLKDRTILVEFSGGIDSSAATLWVKRFYPDNEILLTFVEMGSDFIGLERFLHEFALYVNSKLHILRSPVTMMDLFLQKGKWPHFKFPYCQELLHDALDKNLAKYDADKVVVIRGGRRAEKQPQQSKTPGDIGLDYTVGRREKGRERTAECNCSTCPGSEMASDTSRWMSVNRLPDYPFFQPLYFTVKDVSYSIIEETGAPVWEGYARGMKRTACRICPGQRPSAYAAMRREYPDIWDELLWLEQRLGVGYWGAQCDDSSLIELADRADRQIKLWAKREEKRTEKEKKKTAKRKAKA